MVKPSLLTFDPLPTYHGYMGGQITPILLEFHPLGINIPK